MHPVVFSRKSDEWETPSDFFETLDKEFGFNLDPCATKDNHKCEDYFTVEQDGLTKNWGGVQSVCKPSVQQDFRMGAKALAESQKPDTVVVMLVPARTDTRWFHDYVYGKAELRFIRGRLRFGHSDNSAPFPSMLCIYKGEKTDEQI